MFSRRQTELLTRTNRGTPMGEVMRRYWIPALLSSEIPAPDCPPVRVKLLGEDLVAFRDTIGRVGLLAEHCVHRGTSLFFGRNEACGLRCVYHGWKYDVEGRVVDTPAEPPTSRFKEKVRITAYPCIESQGLVFAFLGPRDRVPVFPAFAWAALPRDHAYPTKTALACNYLQGIEGECDSAHLNFLHRNFGAEYANTPFYQDAVVAYETEAADFGVRIAALRNLSGQVYVRITSFVVPNQCWVPAGPWGKEIHFYTPADDQYCWRFDLHIRADAPIQADDVFRSTAIGHGFQLVRNLSNNYLIDREMQRTVNYTGIEEYTTFLAQDAMATESMGPIYDRSQEHLGVSDKGVIAVRRYLLKVAEAMAKGVESTPITEDPDDPLRHIDAVKAMLPPHTHWRDHFTHLTRPSPPKGRAMVSGG